MNENESPTSVSRLNVKKKRGDRRKKVYPILITIVILCILLAGAYGVYQWNQNIREQEHLAYLSSVVNVETFYEGIYIDGIDLNGLSFTDAQTLLQAEAVKRLGMIHFNLKLGTQTWTLNYKDINATINTDQVLQEAFQLGRDGDLEERYNFVRDLAQNNIHLDTELSFDYSLLENYVQNLAENIEKKPVDATISFFPDEKEKFKITSENRGRILEKDQLLDILQTRIADQDFSDIILETKNVEPSVFKADLEKLTSRVVQFDTGFGTSSANRIHNVRFSMSKVNGVILEPGEVFSFNEVVGRRTVERGFKPAPIIMPDRSMRDSPGGGVCQASTMVYVAALLADLEIVERRHHSFPVFYVPAGLDAAVVYGSLDVKFRNNRETPLFFRTFYENRRIFIEVYGEAFPNNAEIKLESRITETIAAPVPLRIRDELKEHVTNPGEEKVHVENRKGLRVQSTITLVENGSQIWTRVVANDFYRPIQGIIYYLPPLIETEVVAPSAPTDSEQSETEEVSG